VPYVVFRNVGGDSGFIEIVEPLAYMRKHYGVVSAVYVDGDIDTKASWPGSGDIPYVFAQHVLQPRQDSYRFPLDVSTASRAFPGQASSPIDFIFTNRKHIAHALVTPSYDFRIKRHMVPVILDVLKAGLQTHDVVSPELLKYEAMSYAAVDRIIFSTDKERSYGITIAKRHLAPSLVREVEQKSVVIADGISDVLTEISPTTDQLVKRLRKPKDPLRVVFAGRMNPNKRPEKIFDVMRPLYALHNIKLSLVTQSFSVPKHKKEWQDVPCFLTDSISGVGKERFLREVVAKSDLFLNASLYEGYIVTVAEAIYAGVPVLLPRRPWSLSLVGENYPFFYETKEQMYGLVSLIKEGKNISFSQINAFEETRIKFSKDLGSNCAEQIYQIACEEVKKVDDLAQSEPHVKVLDFLFKKFKVGDVLPMAKIGKLYPHPRLRVWNGFDNFFLYKYIKPYVEPVSFNGCVLKRVR
jgi:glycosyltransferase involved in cell wall biosynthesis